MRVERLESTDAKDGLLLSGAAGWNQTLEDWEFLLERSEAFGVRARGELIATVAVMRYPHGLSWICMMLVRADHRRRGLASRLIRTSLDRITEYGGRAGLDATAQGRQVYGKLGFKGTFDIHRFRGRLSALGGEAYGHCAPLTALDRAMLKIDRDAFDDDRSALLRHLQARRPELAWSSAHGFVLGRNGSMATQIGPLVADDEPHAIALLSRSAAHCGGAVIIDVPARRTALCRWLASKGCEIERSFVRMYRGGEPAPSPPESLMATTGPEFA